MSEYTWLALGQELDDRMSKLMDVIGIAFRDDGKLCAAKVVALGLVVRDVETALASIRNLLEQINEGSGACGEEAQIGCWICRPTVSFQLTDGEVVQVEDHEAWNMEANGEGKTLGPVRGIQIKIGDEDESEPKSTGGGMARIVH